MTLARHRAAAAALATAACLMLAGCAGGGGLGWSAAGTAGTVTSTPTAAPLPAPPVEVPLAQVLPQGQGVPIGMYAEGFPRTTTAASSFASATGVQPRMLAYYSGWGSAFATSFAKSAHADDAVPVVKLEPFNVTMTSIVAGQADAYLQRYARAVRAYRYPVILSFAHEMNGYWYTWGDTHTQPADFIAAWRHVVTLFRRAGAVNVKWMWTVNNVSSASMAVQPWWPGQQWVDLVGLDGYYYTGNDTFSRVFGTTLGQIRQVTSAPVMIAETGIGGNPSRNSQIRGLLAGAKKNDIFGIIWFDVTQSGSLYHQNWRLEADPAAAAVFKDAVASS